MSPATQRARYASLDCLVVNGSPEPSAAVVLCHGYGASGHDLAGLAAEWIELLGGAAEPFRFVFPAAPLTLAEMGMPDARAWWPINMARLGELAQTQRFDELHDKHPPGLDEARTQLCESVAAVTDELGGADTPLVLGGFSQGAMLTMDAALRGLEKPPRCLIQFSGTLICRGAWETAAARLESTPVFQSHGTLDPILPIASAEALRDLLRAQGVSVEFHSFPGPHTIDVGALTKSAEMLQALAESIRP